MKQFIVFKSIFWLSFSNYQDQIASDVRPQMLSLHKNHQLMIMMSLDFQWLSQLPLSRKKKYINMWILLFVIQFLFNNQFSLYFPDEPYHYSSINELILVSTDAEGNKDKVSEGL